MGSKAMFLFRRTNVMNLIQQKRLRTKWISRHPSKVLNEGSDSEINVDSEVKLNIERQILKQGRGLYMQEEPHFKETDSLPKSISSRLRKLSLEESCSVKNDSDIRQSKKQESELNRPDPFALSSVLPTDEKDDADLPDSELPSTFRNTEATYKKSRNFEQSFRDIPKETLVNDSPMKEKNSRRKPKSDTRNMWPPRVVKREEGDQRLSQVMLQTKSRKMREKHSLVVIEGKRLINDFINAGAIPKTLFFSRQQDVDGICVPENSTELYKVTYKQLSLWCDVETSQGVIGVFEKSQVVKLTPSENSLPITVICDNVRDPGNMGSVLRIAAGAGCEKVLLTKGCVDVWDSKVLRSAAGAHCHLPVLKDLSWEEVSENLPDGCITFAADNSPSQDGAKPLVHYNKADFGSAPHVALVVGGETHGLSSSALSLASARLHVPISPDIDSLNTAAAFAVIVFEARRALTAGT